MESIIVNPKAPINYGLTFFSTMGLYFLYINQTDSKLFLIILQL